MSERSAQDGAARLEWALEQCRRTQLRMTRSRRAILLTLAESPLPASLDRIAQATPVRGVCDPATVYRTLALLKAAEIVRSVGTTSKAGWYLLNIPGEHCHFLICRRCGVVRALPCGGSMHHLEDEVARTTGYSRLQHELTFYGVCPKCQLQPESSPTLKLPVRV